MSQSTSPISEPVTTSPQMDHTTQKLVAFTQQLQWHHLSQAAVASAKARILSTIAVSLAAFDMPPVKIARQLAYETASGPKASLIGSLLKTTPDMAAFVNAAMVRCLDMSDSYVMQAVSHPADAFAAILAVAEAHQQSGQDLLLALAITYEVQCRFVEVVPYNHHGWDQTPVVALGAALGCAKLLKLSASQTAHAISLAVAPNISLNQTRTGTLSMWKGMAGPQGARAGVHAAYLAREGMTGPDGIFEGKFGFWNQLMGGTGYDIPLPPQFNHHVFAIEQTMIKSFPTRFNCQVPVFAAQKLRQQVDIKEIVSLKIESIRQAFARWMDLPEIWAPQTRETADHSLPCTVAMALLDGTITPQMMNSERFKHPDVLDLMQRCKLEMPDEFANLAPAVRCCRLTATLKNGNTVVQEYRRSTADDQADSGWDAALEKFNTLTENLLNRSAQQELTQFIQSLDQRQDLGTLVALTHLALR